MSENREEFYRNPLISRYASEKMSRIWGNQSRIETWRRLWIALATAQQELGLDISEEQIAEMQAQLSSIDFEVAADYEKKLRHDVMAHVHTYGDVCPTARPIIHLGATSCFVTDNGDLMLIRESLQLVANRLAKVIDSLAKFSDDYKSLPCLGFTHLQPAQPTTVGKRATLWNFDLLLDLEKLEQLQSGLRARGVKGTTGTQASFLNLFDGDHQKVEQLDEKVAEQIGFSGTYPVTGQTYTRKIDVMVLDAMSGIAQSAHKMATDLRLLANRKELEEPFEKSQIGSSAMAYKRNPMRSERVCSLARFVMSLQTSAAATLATQWMERTLDDSANRRLVLPQAFLAIDSILILLENICSGIVVYENVITQNLLAELPFMATENIMMEAVRQGADRQEIHERIRTHSQAAANEIKNCGRPNDLMDRLKSDSAFSAIDLDSILDPAAYVGRAPEQVQHFNSEWIDPIRARYADQELVEEALRV